MLRLGFVGVRGQRFNDYDMHDYEYNPAPPPP